MVTVAELTDPKSNYLVKPLLIGSGFNICETCYAAIPTASYTRCFQCNKHIATGYLLADLVVPIAMAVESLHPDLDQYPYELLNYKSHPNPTVADQFQMGLLATLWRWLKVHENCLINTIYPPTEYDHTSPASFDLVTSVPSTRGRVGSHPLEVMLRDRIPITQSRYESTLRASSNLGDRRQMSNAMFSPKVPLVNIEGKTILLIDDTWTTGAKAQSAAHSLKIAGAKKVVILVLGRWLSPTTLEPFKSISTSYVSQIRETTWNWDSCVLNP